MAPLTGIALAIKRLKIKLNQKSSLVKTTRMTTFSGPHFLHAAVIAVFMSCFECCCVLMMVRLFLQHLSEWRLTNSGFDP
ncbi:hypothetical protein BK881_003182 [Salmonella enterica subsp. enterica]|nr:hypothetical protein [Salmonella enterica subsp. enterica]